MTPKTIDTVKVAAFPLMLGIVAYYGNRLVDRVDDIYTRVIRMEERLETDHKEIERLRGDVPPPEKKSITYWPQAAILPDNTYTLTPKTK